jgi:hypothetical protein
MKQLEKPKDPPREGFTYGETFFFDTPNQDFLALIRCGRCEHVTSVIDCAKTGTGWGGVYENRVHAISCPHCRQQFGLLDEYPSDVSPQIVLYSGCKFVYPPSEP